MENTGYQKTKIDSRITIAVAVLLVIATILAIAIPASMKTTLSWPKSIEIVDSNKVEESIDEGEDFYLFIGIDPTNDPVEGDVNGVYYNSKYFIDGKVSGENNYLSMEGSYTKLANLEITNTYALLASTPEEASANAESVYRYLIDVDGDSTTTGMTISKDDFLWFVADGNKHTSTAILNESQISGGNTYEDVQSGTVATSTFSYLVTNLNEGTCLVGTDSATKVKFNSNADCYSTKLNGDKVDYFYEDPLVRNIGSVDDPTSDSSVYGFDKVSSMGSAYASVAPQLIKFGNRPDGTYGIEYTTMFSTSTLDVNALLDIHNWMEGTDYSVSASKEPLEGWEITLIVLGSIGGVVILIFTGYWIYENKYIASK